jgi:hypothetical protein
MQLLHDLAVLINDVVILTRPFVEWLFFLSGVALCFIAFRGLRQIDLLKTDMLARSERSAKEKAIGACDKFLSESISEQGKYVKALVNGGNAVAPASWSAPALRRFSRGGRKAAEGCRSPKPRGVSDVSFTPWLQPGVKRNARIENRFNGFSPRGKAVETAGVFPPHVFHRAEATVLMRTGR